MRAVPAHRFTLALLLLASAGCGESLIEYRNETAGFRVLLPGEPSPVPADKLPKGVQSVMLQQRSGEYVIAWEESKVEEKLDTQARLDAVCDEAVSRLKATELSRRPISLDSKFHGRDLMLKTKDGKKVVHLRTFLIDGRLYKLIASGPSWWIESAEVKKVMHSLRLLEE